MVQTQVRGCHVEDATALSLVGQSSFIETFAGVLNGSDIILHCLTSHTPSVYKAWLEDSSSKLWIAEALPGNAPVGYLVLAPASLPIENPQADDLEVKRIYLLHRFHGCGLGKDLMLEAIGYAKQVNCRRLLLGVYRNNAQAIAFYERFGFRQIGVRQFRVGERDYDDTILALQISVNA